MQSGQTAWRGLDLGAVLALAAAALGAGLLLARSACAPANVGSTVPLSVGSATPRGQAATTATLPLPASALPAAAHAGPRLARAVIDAGAPRGLARGAAAAPAALDPSGLQATFRAARQDPRGLTLLANIERELRRDPPRELHAILAAQRGGAGRAALLERIRRDLPEDVVLRALVVRWLNEVAPDPQATTAAVRAPGSGENRWLAPLERR